MTDRQKAARDEWLSNLGQLVTRRPELAGVGLAPVSREAVSG